jgi:hypothetical protein
MKWPDLVLLGNRQLMIWSKSLYVDISTLFDSFTKNYSAIRHSREDRNPDVLINLFDGRLADSIILFCCNSIEFDNQPKTAGCYAASANGTSLEYISE